MGMNLKERDCNLVTPTSVRRIIVCYACRVQWHMWPSRPGSRMPNCRTISCTAKTWIAASTTRCWRTVPSSLTWRCCLPLTRLKLVKRCQICFELVIRDKVADLTKLIYLNVIWVLFSFDNLVALLWHINRIIHCLFKEILVLEQYVIFHKN